MTGRPGSSALESELWRLLTHARGCDGFKRDDAGKLISCPTCSAIDKRLEDGASYFADDPLFRVQTIDKVLAKVHQQGLRIERVLENSNLPHSTRAAMVQLCEWIDRTRGLLTLPITQLPGYEPPRVAAAPAPEAPAREQPVRRREGPRPQRVAAPPALPTRVRRTVAIALVPALQRA